MIPKAVFGLTARSQSCMPLSIIYSCKHEQYSTYQPYNIQT